MTEVFVESQVLELKREFSEGIRKTVVAFANTDGGKILIGIDDNGVVVGVDDPNECMLQISSSIRDTVCPDVMMFIGIDVELMAGKSVVVLEVNRGTVCPYYVKSKGVRPEGVFVRVGSSTIPASESAILKMIEETSGNRYEVARSLEQNLTFDSTGQYFVGKDLIFEDVKKKTLGLVGIDDTYTNLAFLLSDQCTHSIKVAVFEGSHKRTFKDRREFKGSVLKQATDVYDFIDRHNKISTSFSGLDRVDVRDYPEEVIRETLLNAVCHRDYGLSASTLISIFDDRIEFVTIGALMKGISLSDIMLGVSVSRNSNLANVFYRLKLIEAYGTGIQKIMECYSDYDFKPNIEVSDNAFKVMIPNVNFYMESNRMESKDSNLTERECKVLKLFDGEVFITRNDVEKALGISQATAIKLLRSMFSKGIVDKHGSGKNLKYILK